MGQAWKWGTHITATLFHWPQSHSYIYCRIAGRCRPAVCQGERGLAWDTALPWNMRGEVMGKREQALWGNHPGQS